MQLHNAIVTIYSQVVHQPSGIRRFWFGVSLLSPLRPIHRNGNPLPKFLGNAFTGVRILQRPTPRHLWATDRPRMCYPTCQQLQLTLALAIINFLRSDHRYRHYSNIYLHIYSEHEPFSFSQLKEFHI